MNVKFLKLKKFLFIIIVIAILLTIFLIFFSKKSYENMNIGNNNLNKTLEEVEDYILNIKSYTATIEVTVNSNKNSNSYTLLQSNYEGISRQEIRSTENDSGIIIENVDNCLTIKNTQLPVEKVFSDYADVIKNSVGLDSFIDDYLCDENKEVIDKDGYYIISVRNKNSQNKYSLSKKLFFNKEKNSIEKIVVKDINNNETTIIEYIKLEIL